MNLSVGKRLALFSFVTFLGVGAVLLGAAHRTLKTELVESAFREAVWNARKGAFAPQEGVFTFVVNANGTLLDQSELGHFDAGEDLSHLPIFHWAKSSPAEVGTLMYSELPGKSRQYAAFKKSAGGARIAIAQVPDTKIQALLKGFYRKAGALLVGFGGLCALLCGLMSWGLVSYRIRRITKFLVSSKGIDTDLKVPEIKHPDEIGQLAALIQSMREGSSGTATAASEFDATPADVKTDVSLEVESMGEDEDTDITLEIPQEDFEEEEKAA
jgi:hypothetical protein